MASESAKDKIIWTKAMNLDLAKFMEDKPNIWDTKHPRFSHIGLRDETFAEFASRYDMDWQAVRDRWTNIRSSYGFYMRKISARKSSGQDFKVGWFMWKPCKYLFNVHKPSKQKKTTSEGATEDHEVSKGSTDDHEASNDATFSDNSDADDKKDTTTCQGIVNNIAVVLKGVQNNTFDTQRSKHAAVGDAVTTLLSQLDSYEAAQMSQKIIEILAEYDEKNPMNPNGLRFTVNNSD